MSECKTCGKELLDPQTIYCGRVCGEIGDLRKRFTAPIVCMCGSTKFKQAWIAENARLTGEGNIVLAVGLWGHHERKHPAPEVKVKLDDLHKRKIDLCDWVWVLDVDGYIGESTRSEIEYAKRLDKPIRYLSKEFSGYKEPVDQLDEYKAHNALLVGALQEVKAKLAIAYKTMNWFASGESMKEYKRIEPTDILIEVYQVLGPVPGEIEQALSTTPSEAYEQAQGIVAALEAWESIYVGGSYQAIGRCPKCGNDMPSISHQMCQGCAVELTKEVLQRYRGGERK